VQQQASSSVQHSVLSHFGLRENPFGVTPDPRFLFFSQSHREALASLINGIEWGFGFQALVAQPGMGKTTLLLDLLRMFQGKAHTAFLFQPQLTPVELLQSLLSELGVTSQGTSIRDLCEEINRFLVAAAEVNKRVIIILDEAQNLDFTTLEMLRQLSNFETPRAKLMHVILAGQPQLLKKLSAPEQQQLQQRISAIGRLSPLSAEDTRSYIEHRLKTAGADKSGLFPPNITREIWQTSKGIPRNINRLCFSTMLLAFTEHANLVSSGSLREAISDLDPDQIFLQMGPPDEPKKNAGLETTTFVLPELPPRTNSEPVFAVSALPHPETVASSDIEISAVAATQLNARSMRSGEATAPSQRASTIADSGVLVADKQPADDALNLTAAGTTKPKITSARPGLSIAEVRINKPASPPHQPDRTSLPLPEQRSHRLWPRISLLSIFIGLLIWLVTGKAAPGSWPQPSRFYITPSTAAPSPGAAQIAPPNKSRSIATLHFEESSAQLDAESRSSLEGVADMLAGNPDLYVVLEGHTDDSGPEAYNLDLSGRRSLAVRDVLCNELHVSPDRVKVTALGSADPDEPNSSDAGRAHNRRVEIRIAERNGHS
jgi:type II secretory pathway predicted ATPase ExeA/outer membrane protein OmpA-like peptidoglycan-associated protein